MKTFAAYIAGIFTTVVLTSALSWAGHPLVYRYFKPHTDSTVCVQVKWTPNEQDNIKRCGGAGCAYPNKDENGRIRQDVWQVMTVPIIRDFNDHRRLEILGHEFYHLLGGDHD